MELLQLGYRRYLKDCKYRSGQDILSDYQMHSQEWDERKNYYNGKTNNFSVVAKFNCTQIQSTTKDTEKNIIKTRYHVESNYDCSLLF